MERTVVKRKKKGRKRILFFSSWCVRNLPCLRRQEVQRFFGKKFGMVLKEEERGKRMGNRV